MMLRIAMFLLVCAPAFAGGPFNQYSPAAGVQYNATGNTPTNTAATSAQILPLTICALNPQTGTTYTLVLGDQFGCVGMSSASANTVTVPTNASVPFAIGTRVSIQQVGAGLTTLAAAGGVTLQLGTGVPSWTTGTQYGEIAIRKVATDTWTQDNQNSTWPTYGFIGLGVRPSCAASTFFTVCPPGSGVIVLNNPDAATSHAVFIAGADGTGGTDGGVFQESAGNGSAPNGNGGSHDIYSGNGFGTGAGGQTGILAGSATGTGQGGIVTIGGGSSVGGHAGGVVLNGGGSGGAQQGGDIDINAGQGGATNGKGGGSTFTAGQGGGSGAGGDFIIMGGNGGLVGNSVGGTISVIAGQAGANSTGVGGDLILQPGNTSMGALTGHLRLNEANGITVGDISTDISIPAITSLFGDTSLSASITNIVGPSAANTQTNGSPTCSNATGCPATTTALAGTTGSIGGGALLAGACASGTATVTGATSSMAVAVSPNGDPDSNLATGIAFYAFVSATNTVTVRVCAIVAVTPTARTYNVRVLQ